MMILVCGATGILGGRITKRLLQIDEKVRILVRDPSPAEQLSSQGMATSPGNLIEQGAQPVYGDLKDPKTLEKACHGVDVIITTANSAMRGGEDTVDTVDRQGNRNLIEAARMARVQQFIFISFLGADLHHPVPLFKAKAETEELLKKEQMVYTILAPNFFTETWAGMVVGIPLRSNQPVTLVADGSHQHSFISMEDVAAFTIASIGRSPVFNQRLILGGPQAVSWREIVATFSHVVGKDIPIRTILPGEPLPGLPEIVSPTLAAMETYDSVIPMAETARLLGVTQLPLAAVVRKMLGIVNE